MSLRDCISSVCAEILASIMKEPLQQRDNLHDFFTPAAADLALGLLAIEPTHRLGAASFSQIIGHAFFAGTPWETMSQTEPPFIPVLSHEGDTSYFDEAGPELKKDNAAYDSEEDHNSEDEQDFKHIGGVNIDQLLELTYDAASLRVATTALS